MKNIKYKRIDDFNHLKEESECNIIWSPGKWFDPREFLGKVIMFGPQFFVFPDKPLIGTPGSYGDNCFYNVLSEWVRNMYYSVNKEEFIMPLCTFPFGVDTDKFSPINQEKKEIFIYNKFRHPSKKQEIKDKLQNKFIINEITYGTYNEEIYLGVLRKCRFGIWIGCSESQGFALQEALSCNVPIFVYDVTSMKDEFNNRFIYENNSYPLTATSVSYWSSSCGEKITDIKEFDDKFNYFLNNLENYKPREFILENLSIEKCMSSLIKKCESLLK